MKIGDRYVLCRDYGDPWAGNSHDYTVIGIKGKWVRLRHISGFEISTTKFTMWCVYKKLK